MKPTTIFKSSTKNKLSNNNYRPRGDTPACSKFLAYACVCERESERERERGQSIRTNVFVYNKAWTSLLCFKERGIITNIVDINLPYLILLV